MTWFRSSRSSFAVLAATLAMCACNETLGPSLEVSVTPNPATKLATASSGNMAVCCCALSASVENRSAVPVHASLRWKGYDASNAEIGAGAVAFVKDIQPGENRAFTSAGFQASCDSIARVGDVEVDLVGLWQP